MNSLLQSALILAILLASTTPCPEEVNCLECSNPKESEQPQCLACEDTFWNPLKKVCDTNIGTPVSNCKTYDRHGKAITCSRCDFGFYLDINKNACVSCALSDCAICQPDGHCSGCFHQMKIDLQTNTCSKEQTCEIPVCKICVNHGNGVTCAKCSSGYALNSANGICVPSTENCFIVDETNRNMCAQCDWGYFIKMDGTCSLNNVGFDWKIVMIPGIGLTAVFLIVLAYCYFKGKNQNVEIYDAA